MFNKEQKQLSANVTDIIAQAKKYVSDKLGDDELLTQFINELCVYCLDNIYYKSAQSHLPVIVRGFYANLPLSKAKLCIAAGALCRLIGKENIWKGFYKQQQEINSYASVGIDLGDKEVVPVKDPKLVKLIICAQEALFSSDHYRLFCSNTVAALEPVPVAPGKLDRLCQDALTNVRSSIVGRGAGIELR